MNLFEKQNKPFAIKLSDRVKEEIEKTFGTTYLNAKFNYLLYYSNINCNYWNNLPKGIDLITEAEFFGDGSNKLREKIKLKVFGGKYGKN